MVLPPIIGGEYMCLYVILLVNKYCYWLARKGKGQSVLQKPSVIAQDNLICHENYCFLCEIETTSSRKLLLP